MEDETPTPSTLRQVLDAGPKWHAESEGSLLSTQDSYEASDEKLLAMLSDLAKGEEDSAESPEELRAEVEAKREMQRRLRRELQQLQERSRWQCQESNAFMQRLCSARDALAEKIQDANSENLELRSRLGNCKEQVAQLRRSRPPVVSLSEVTCQARLVEELAAASRCQAALQEELYQERQKTWRASGAVLRAFAGLDAIESSLDTRAAEAEALRAVAERAARCGVHLELDDAEPEGLDIQPLEQHLADLELHRDELKAIQVELQESDEDSELLQTHQELLSAESRMEVCRPQLEEAEALVSLLRAELRSEQAVAREEQSAQQRRREVFRSQVEEKRRELRRIQECQRCAAV
ncbi:unnamed protein product [Effrenium voratum]|uniref:Uncharacterized protein n=1 Tax=Effrenium voratum TaxID=2562239 RepID=A0AA36NI74_9DINO|nr:unnamed protein product [Effrenium voratum]CAJ1453956.1 unnamed protein product [Effrenium voratum]